MKNLKEKLNSKLHTIQYEAKYILSDNRGASLWEYLLVIALVCVIGGIIIATVSGNNGIGAIWDTLMARFRTLINS